MEDEEIEDAQPFVGLLNIEEDELDHVAEEYDSAASILNPNVNDDRRLFQEKNQITDCDCAIPVNQQPNIGQIIGIKLNVGSL